MKEIAESIVYLIFGIGLLILYLVIFGLGWSYGKDDLIQKLCTKQQYDFCEVVEQKHEYKLKERKND